MAVCEKSEQELGQEMDILEMLEQMDKAIEENRYSRTLIAYVDDDEEDAEGSEESAKK